MLTFQELSQILDDHSANHRELASQLGKLLRSASSNDARYLVYLASGRLGATYAPRISWARALNAKDLPARRHPDTGNEDTTISPATIADVYRTLHNLDPISPNWTPPRGYQEKLLLLVPSMSELELKWLANIISGWNLPDEGIIIDAIERSTKGGVGARETIDSVIKHFVPDIGIVAEVVKEGGIVDLASLRRIQYCMPVPVESMNHCLPANLSATLMRLKSQRQYVQAKSDGLYVQIHKFNEEIHLFLESGVDIANDVPDIVENIRKLPVRDVILDAEIVGVDEKKGSVLPRERTLRAARHQAIVFDLIKQGIEDTRTLRYEDRRKKMEEIVRNGPPHYSPGIFLAEEELVSGREAVLRIFHQFTDKSRYEGVVLKSPAAQWQQKDGKFVPKRIKLKNYITLDMLLVGFYLHKDTRKPTSFLLALRTEDDNTFQPCAIAVAKYSIAGEIVKHCLATQSEIPPKHVIAQGKPDYWTNGQRVVEVETDGLIEKDAEGLFPDVGWTLHNSRQRMIIFIRSDKTKPKANMLTQLLTMKPAPGFSE